eukprot:TRINITY_DN7629_c0_g1_i1.p2 TRINITY_DN7629_c0_g1~~TRINITY_DN7629_c0_g1_i1.p2  ORF type:complete len:166 (+),score=32.85 TRINITY_DN7629_c0_g1_i1:638-1135(+)
MHAGMVGNAANNALKTVLDAKVNRAAAYDDNDVRALLNAIINTPVGDGNALRTIVTDLTSRITQVEGIANHDCGNTCAPGQRVTTACDAANKIKTSCGSCPANTYSYGGLSTSCLSCSQCQNGFHQVADCTPSSDRVCAKCRAWPSLSLGLLHHVHRRRAIPQAG